VERKGGSPDIGILRTRRHDVEEATRKLRGGVKVEDIVSDECRERQAELRQALAVKEAKLAAGWAVLVDEQRQRAGTDQLREELRKAQADVKSL
jgi:hypothetical protein